MDTTSDHKPQSARGRPGQDVEHITRRGRVKSCGMREKWSKMMKKLPSVHTDLQNQRPERRADVFGQLPVLVMREQVDVEGEFVDRVAVLTMTRWRKRTTRTSKKAHR